MLKYVLILMLFTSPHFSFVTEKSDSDSEVQ